MKRIRNFLCRMDPIGATFVIVLGGILLVEAIAVGFGKFFMIVGIGLALSLIVLAIGYGVYRLISYLQDGCRRGKW